VIDSVSGEVVRKGGDFVVVDNGGIAYQVSCSTSTLRECEEGRSALLYTHLLIRDDSVQLYGFSRLEEREVFQQLLTVGQIGPRLALQVLSTLPPSSLIEAIRTNSVERLTAVKGIGRKTAERILVELRDKIGSSAAAPGSFLLSQNEETALRALTQVFGFSPREARPVIEQLRGEALSTEDLVRRSLELLGRQR
jgi:Holliday junction DNA helicase RuvA